MIPLIFPKVPQSFLRILRVPQLPPPLGHLLTDHDQPGSSLFQKLHPDWILYEKSGEIL